LTESGRIYFKFEIGCFECGGIGEGELPVELIGFGEFIDEGDEVVTWSVLRFAVEGGCETADLLIGGDGCIAVVLAGGVEGEGGLFVEGGEVGVGDGEVEHEELVEFGQVVDGLAFDE
jgi:hypothetical protein